MDIEVCVSNGGCIRIELGEKICSGSNSHIYNVASINDEAVEKLVAKCSKSPANYISFNLQSISCISLEKLAPKDIAVPKIQCYGSSEDIGDILIIEKMEDLSDIYSVINQIPRYGELIIGKAAEAIALLHSQGISGYDIELYWDVNKAKLIILDIGPLYTINCSSEEMLTRHWSMENANMIGRWNIISQIIPEDEAKAIFKDRSVIDIGLDYILRYIDENSVQLHVKNVAQTHALAIIGRTDKAYRRKYMELFVSKYKHIYAGLNCEKDRYIEEFEKTVLMDKKSAKAKRYYSKVKTLSEESCEICIN